MEEEAPVVELESLPSVSYDGWMKELLRHAITPLFIGAFLGGFWQLFMMDRVGEMGLPMPVQGAFIIALPFSPFICKLLVPNSQGKLWQYSLGMFIMALVYSSIWMSGWGAMFCGGYFSGLVWIWINMTWWNYELPPFRYAIWHSIAIDLGAFGGALIVYFNL